jgi:DNA-binding beta-propeller fold protein YncE
VGVSQLWLGPFCARCLFPWRAAQQSKLRIVQTNGVGHNLSIIDPATNKVVAEIKGIEAAHGVAAAKDGSRIYVSKKADRSLDVVDGKTPRVAY